MPRNIGTGHALIGALALMVGGAAGCKTEQREAQTREQAARQELREGQQEADKALQEGREKAADEMAEAREEAADEREKLGDELRGERQPVAGRDTAMGAAGGAALESQLRDKYGKEWTVVRATPSGFTLTRIRTKAADTNYRKKLDDEVKSVGEDKAGLNATYTGQQVSLKGATESCDKLLDQIDEFAGIDGVNKIDVSATCAPKK